MVRCEGWPSLWVWTVWPTAKWTDLHHRGTKRAWKVKVSGSGGFHRSWFQEVKIHVIICYQLLLETNLLRNGHSYVGHNSNFGWIIEVQGVGLATTCAHVGLGDSLECCHQVADHCTLHLDHSWMKQNVWIVTCRTCVMPKTNELIGSWGKRWLEEDYRCVEKREHPQKLRSLGRPAIRQEYQYPADFGFFVNNKRLSNPVRFCKNVLQTHRLSSLATPGKTPHRGFPICSWRK